MEVLITSDVAPDWADLPPDLVIRVCEPEPAALAAAITGAEILVSEVLPAGGEAAALRWVQLLSAGTEQLIGHPLARRDLLICSAAGVSAVHIAEYIVGRALDHLKEFGAYRQLQAAGDWPAERVALARPALRGLSALLIGYGGIGRETARLLSAFGVRVVAITPAGERRRYRGFAPFPGLGDPEAQIPERVVGPVGLHAELGQADIVVLAAPLLAPTHHMLDAAALAQMKPTAILVNVGRGALIDTAALLAALDAGRLAHAYLDVFETEPLPRASPLWRHPRISITPHISGTLPDHNQQLRRLFLENLERYRAGHELLNRLDLDRFR